MYQSNVNNQSCNSARLWHLIRNLQIANKNNNLKLSEQQINALCNYMNGRPYNRQILKPFIYPKKAS